MAFIGDTLYILVATGCSQNFNTYVYKKWGDDLGTAPATEDLFIPAPNQWRTEAVDLSFFDGVDDVTIGFLNVSNWGNQLFLDNIRVGVDCGLMTAEWQITPDGCNPSGICSGEAEINVPISNGNVAYEWENIPTGPTQSVVTDLCSGNLSVTITDEFGASASQVIVIDIEGINDDPVILGSSSLVGDITEGVFDVLGVDNSVASRTSLGGTAPANVRAEIEMWKERLT